MVDGDYREISIINPIIRDTHKFYHNSSGKIKGKTGILRSIFERVMAVKIYKMHKNGSILYKNTELEMEGGRIICVKFKGKRITESVENGFAFSFEGNRDFENLLK